MSSSQVGPLRVIAGTPDKPLRIGEIEIPAYVLEDETRVLSQRGFLAGIGRSRRVGPSQSRARKQAAETDDVPLGENPVTPENRARELPMFLSADNLQPFISPELIESAIPVVFQSPQGGGRAYGYRATLLPEVCTVYLRARDAGVLRAAQRHIADRAEVLVRGLASVGIIGLVDEATGYQRVREERALAGILERFIAAELRPWTKTFPFSFYEQVFRLRNWGSPEGGNRPAIIGHYTNDLVYQRIAPGVLDELRKKNPVIPQTGRRRTLHHQWFTEDYGHPKLKEHIAAVTALMRAADDWESFMRSLNRAFPVINKMIEMPLSY